MGVCKFIVTLWYGGILNCRLAASPFVRLVEREENCEAPNHSEAVFPQYWGGTKPNHVVICMVLKTTASDKRIISSLAR
ncbi:hypothetical protein TNCV_5031931 [Trichonephila clavipes]|nr:hypothetical protein TNCV_5031931 [Trichonephila clavipes]